MKIGNKYYYFKKVLKPKLEDYKNTESFSIANSIYKLSRVDHIFATEALNPENSPKIGTERLEKRRIKVGEKVLIERWDSNGIPDKVKIINIKESRSRVLVYCNKGWFVFSKWNFTKEDILFNWTCRGKKWEKEYMKWIDGNKYYYKS